MKKVLGLILALTLILCFASTALAADSITITKVEADVAGTKKDITTTLGSQFIDYDATVIITGSYTLAQEGDAGIYTNIDNDTVTENAGVFTVTFSAADITSAAGDIIVHLSDKDKASINIKVALEPVLTSLEISRGSTKYPITLTKGTYDYDFTIPSSNNTVSDIYTIKGISSGNDVSDADFNGTSSGNEIITVTSASGQTQTYTIDISTPGTSANVSSLSVGTTSVSSPSSGNTTAATAKAIALTSNVSEHTLSVSVSDGASYKIYNAHTGSATTNDITTTKKINFGTTSVAANFRIEVTSEDSKTTKTYYYTATRTGTGTTTTVSLLSSLYVSSTSTGGSISGSTTITTTSGTNPSTRTLTVPSDYANQTVYLRFTESANANVTSPTTLTYYAVALSNAGTSRSVNLTITHDGKTYTAPVSIYVDNADLAVLDEFLPKDRKTTSTSSSYELEIDPSFKSGTTKYDIIVPNDLDTIYFYYETDPSNEDIDIEGDIKDFDINDDYIEIELEDGDQEVEVIVGSGSEENTYQFEIIREDDVEVDASLDDLELRKTSSSSSTQYDISPTFRWNNLQYSADFDDDIDEVYLHLDPDESDAEITISPSSAVEEIDDDIYKITLDIDDTLELDIHIENGNDEATYELELRSGDAAEETTEDAQLKGLLVASNDSTSSSYQYDLLPEFEADITNYVVFIPFDEDEDLQEFFIRPTLDDEDDDLTVEDKSYDSADWIEFSLDPGDKETVEIEVEDDDDNITRYNLTVVAADEDADDEALLDELELRTGSATSTKINFSPDFDEDTEEYSANVDNDQDDIRIYADTTDSYAHILVDGIYMSGSYIVVELEEGENIIPIVVYAEDCDSHTEYELTVNRGTSDEAGFLYTLQVRVSDGNTNQTVNLIPKFSGNQTSYKINVPENISQVAFNPYTNPEYDITMLGQQLNNGAWTTNHALKSGDNTFIIDVGIGSESTSYNITIERGLDVVVSNQALELNAKGISSAAYNINGNNYFKLRDLAFALRDTGKKFEVAYNEISRIIELTSNQAYTVIGGEMEAPQAAGNTIISNQRVYVDGKEANLTAYNIDGANYFLLVDLGEIFDFAVGYDEATRTVQMDTSKGYDD